MTKKESDSSLTIIIIIVVCLIFSSIIGGLVWFFREDLFGTTDETESPSPGPSGTPVGSPSISPGPSGTPVGSPGPSGTPVGSPGPRGTPVGSPGPRGTPVGSPGPRGTPGPALCSLPSSTHLNGKTYEFMQYQLKFISHSSSQLLDTANQLTTNYNVTVNLNNDEIRIVDPNTQSVDYDFRYLCTDGLIESGTIRNWVLKPPPPSMPPGNQPTPSIVGKIYKRSVTTSFGGSRDEYLRFNQNSNVDFKWVNPLDSTDTSSPETSGYTISGTTISCQGFSTGPKTIIYNPSDDTLETTFLSTVFIWARTQSWPT